MDTILVSNGKVRESINNSLTKDVNPIYISGRRTAWKEQLIRVLSRYCGCTFMTEKCIIEKTTKYYLVGRKYNITVMRALWNWLSILVQDNAKRDIVGNGRIAVNSYCLGFIDGIDQTVSANPHLSEMIKKEQEAKHFMRLTHYSVDVVPFCNNSHIEEVAFQQGQVKGKSLNINKIFI